MSLKAPTKTYSKVKIGDLKWANDLPDPSYPFIINNRTCNNVENCKTSDNNNCFSAYNAIPYSYDRGDVRFVDISHVKKMSTKSPPETAHECRGDSASWLCYDSGGKGALLGPRRGTAFEPLFGDMVRVRSGVAETVNGKARAGAVLTFSMSPSSTQMTQHVSKEPTAQANVLKFAAIVKQDSAIFPAPDDTVFQAARAGAVYTLSATGQFTRAHSPRPTPDARVGVNVSAPNGTSMAIATAARGAHHSCYPCMHFDSPAAADTTSCRHACFIPTRQENRAGIARHLWGQVE